MLHNLDDEGLLHFVRGDVEALLHDIRGELVHTQVTEAAPERRTELGAGGDEQMHINWRGLLA